MWKDACDRGKFLLGGVEVETRGNRPKGLEREEILRGPMYCPVMLNEKANFDVAEIP